MDARVYNWAFSEDLEFRHFLPIENSTVTLQRPQNITIGFCQQKNLCKIIYLVLK